MPRIENIRSIQASFSGMSAISTLRMIEINPIEICNRVCEFCPRSMPELYPNKNLKTSNFISQKDIVVGAGEHGLVYGISLIGIK